ncbi:MAG: alpha/beta hydrolase [Clostridia bacterium]|nr:alpha/beta hydrolase [Clostridia bacterium]
MENKTYMLWENPPYIKDSEGDFRPSVTEFKVNDNKTAVIVCPGGGYGCKADHEKNPIAEMFNRHGINAFTLDYNVTPCNKMAPLSDLQRAIRTLRSLGYEKVGICGFSAGGHLVCSGATLYNYPAYEMADETDKLSARPDACIACYPVVTMDESFTHMGSRTNLLLKDWDNRSLVELLSCEKHVTKDTPPCFIWHTADDEAVPVRNSMELATALLKNGVRVELHIFPTGCHGLGLAYDRNDIGIWSDCACTFLKNIGF